MKLSAKLADITEERDILKKAVSIFSKQGILKLMDLTVDIGIIFHSDQGIQYASKSFRKLLRIHPKHE